MENIVTLCHHLCTMEKDVFMCTSLCVKYLQKDTEKTGNIVDMARAPDQPGHRFLHSFVLKNFEPCE